MGRREPKTIEEARTLIVAVMPERTWIYLSARWSDHRDRGSNYTNVTYRCSVRLDGRTDSIDVESHLPAQLCRLAIAAVQKALGPLALPAVKPRKASPAARPKLKGPAQPRLSFR